MHIVYRRHLMHLRRSHLIISDALCPYCGGKVKIPHPAKFSLDDKYIKYRIEDVRTAEQLSK